MGCMLVVVVTSVTSVSHHNTISGFCMMQEAGAQAVAAAMMATLPGIDANDPRKTLACFRLYCVVLSSVGILQVWLPQHLS